jgi:hypothetical protein
MIEILCHDSFLCFQKVSIGSAEVSADAAANLKESISGTEPLATPFRLANRQFLFIYAQTNASAESILGG